MALPLWSRITSNSISFQPKMHFSIRTWVMGEQSRPTEPHFPELLLIVGNTAAAAAQGEGRAGQ